MMLVGPFFGRQFRGLGMAGLILASFVGCSGVSGIGGQGDTAAAPPSRILGNGLPQSIAETALKKHRLSTSCFRLAPCSQCWAGGTSKLRLSMQLCSV